MKTFQETSWDMYRYHDALMATLSRTQRRRTIFAQYLVNNAKRTLVAARANAEFQIKADGGYDEIELTVSIRAVCAGGFPFGHDDALMRGQLIGYIKNMSQQDFAAAITTIRKV